MENFIFRLVQCASCLHSWSNCRTLRKYHSLIYKYGGLHQRMHKQSSLQIICTNRQNSYSGHVSDSLGKAKQKNRYLRSSRLEVFCRKGVLRSFAKFTAKHLCQSLFFNKVTGLRPKILLKKRLWHRHFSVNFSKFLRTRFLLQNTPGGCFCCQTKYKTQKR